jgi:hypothetical protein
VQQHMVGGGIELGKSPETVCPEKKPPPTKKAQYVQYSDSRSRDPGAGSRLGKEPGVNRDGRGKCHEKGSQTTNASSKSTWKPCFMRGVYGKCATT